VQWCQHVNSQFGCYTAGTSPVFRANDRLIGHHPIHPPSAGFGRLSTFNSTLLHIMLQLTCKFSRDDAAKHEHPQCSTTSLTPLNTVQAIPQHRDTHSTSCKRCSSHDCAASVGGWLAVPHTTRTPIPLLQSPHPQANKVSRSQQHISRAAPDHQRLPSLIRGRHSCCCALTVTPAA
jgi:hypothetical protein